MKKEGVVGSFRFLGGILVLILVLVMLVVMTSISASQSNWQATALPNVFNGTLINGEPALLFNNTHVGIGLIPHQNATLDIANWTRTQGLRAHLVIIDGNLSIGSESPGGAKLKVVGGIINASGGLVVEVRKTDPQSPVNGQIWLIQQ